MRNRITLAAVLAAGVLALTAAPASAATAGTAAAPAGKDCGALRLTGALPAPPAGMAVQQQITVGADCKPVLGEVKLVPAAKGTAVRARAAADAGTTRQFKSWNEWFDCCNIRMTGLYTTSSWTTDGTRIGAANTDATQQWNREPWDAGWSLKAATKNTDCTTDCAASHTDAHAEFTYKGVFDVTGLWYANTQDSHIDLNADGTATCRFETATRHTFIGWNWQRGCQ
ncbi:hypothetical protein F7Q99_11875 [Streptomyces kaniharaensis]|uniref:Uncharacterized protein n=1 Tax=Streptomyces kaniharaensis TaxID=212423 RepID=A0A6N7KNI1_9ACTN|nr:hypothetical protein [Streptomyces kaniharaensis]MQS12971.1 hypothetical protein [Streptomyces kaniharaensis]